MHRTKKIRRCAETLRNISRRCGLCPRMCGIDRLKGETGVCGETADLRIAAAVSHYGEEPPLTTKGPVGNIFVTGCSLECVYCQNHQASQEGIGDIMTPHQLADEALELQKAGCGGIGWVTPAHQLPALLETYAIAVERGLELPLIYNTSGYERVETLRLIDGLIDIYLTDLRYSDSAMARKYSGADDYVDVSRGAVEEMFRQAGHFDEGVCWGLIVRLLVLPDNIAGIWESLCFIALELSPRIPVSLMSQYHPVHRAGEFPELNRFITFSEYREALKMARSLGFDTIYTQKLDPARHLMPDFSRQDSQFNRI